MAFVTLGVVSNVWSKLPPSTLVERCRAATEQGFEYVELRQRSLGECEETETANGLPWPRPDRLAELRAAVPGLRFNLAVEAPFLTTTVSPRDPYLQRCAEAAFSVGGPDAVLRLVDISPVTSVLDHEETIEEFGRGVEELARHLARQGVRLALENSKQPLIALRAVIRRAAFGLPEGVPIPQVCWDPANQAAQKLLEEDPTETARTVGIEELFMVHFKQARDGELQPDVADGDLDWHAILSALHRRGYRGPALFELPPSPEIWHTLERSTAYIRGLVERIKAEAPAPPVAGRVEP